MKKFAAIAIALGLMTSVVSFAAQDKMTTEKKKKKAKKTEAKM